MAKKAKENASSETVKEKVSLAKAFLQKHKINEYASTLKDSTLSNVTDWIDSGCYSLNKILSGSFKKGFANNKVYILAGPSSTGKSLICARTVARAQKSGYTVAYFDSENAVDNDFMSRFGVDTSDLLYIPVKTISDFRNQTVKLMRDWRSDPTTKDEKLMIFCDSLGGLIGTKEMNDVEENKSASDMGQKAKELRVCARVLTVECAHNKVPLVVTNHTYEQAAANPKAAPIIKMSGGEGFYYAASAIIYLRKRQHKEKQENASGDVKTVKLGNFMIATTEKNRFVPEGTVAEFYVNFEKGVSKYYGLLEDAVKFGFIEIRGPRFYVKHLDKTVWAKDLYNSTIWDPIIDDLDVKVVDSFKFATDGQTKDELSEDDAEVDVDEGSGELSVDD